MSDLPPSQRARALTGLLVANFFWGLSFPLIKALGLLQADLGFAGGTWFSTLYMLAPRFALGALLLAVCWPRHLARITRNEVRQGVMIGLFAAAGMLFQTDGLQFTSASTSAFLTQLYAILIPLWVAFHGRRNPGTLVWICGVLVLTGVAILGQFNWQEMTLGRGEVETLICSLFFMGQILCLEKKEFAGNHPGRLTLVMFATEAVVFLVALVIAAPTSEALFEPWTSTAWVGLTLALTVFCTMAAYGLMNTWQPKITATEAGLIYCVEPIFAAILAAFLPAWLSLWAMIEYANERPTWTLLVGGGLITLANILIQLKPPPAH